MRKVLIAVALLAAACEQKKSKLDDMVTAPRATGSAGEAGDAVDAIDIDSKDILNRKDAAPSVQVKHVLIGWDKLDKVYQGRLDPRAQKRTNADAAKLAKEI